jgi:GNAT superfamily N-acetyltransferase
MKAWAFARPSVTQPIASHWNEKGKRMNRNNLTFRLAALDDLEAALEVYRDVCLWLNDVRGITDQWPRDVPEGEIQDLVASSELYLATLRGEIAGAFKLNEKDHHWDDDGAALYVHAFAVRRKFKGQNIGQMMLDWAADEARRRGKQYLRLDCMDANARLKQYYIEAEMEPRPQNSEYRWSALFERKLT